MQKCIIGYGSKFIIKGAIEIWYFQGRLISDRIAKKIIERCNEQYRSLGLIGTGRWIRTKKEERWWTLKMKDGLLILKQFYLHIIRNIVGSPSETYNLIFYIKIFCPFLSIHLPVPIYPKLRYIFICIWVFDVTITM